MPAPTARPRRRVPLVAPTIIERGAASPQPAAIARQATWSSAGRAAFGAYVRHIADRLELRDWELTIDWTPCDADAMATICPVEGQKRAVLRLGAGFLDWPAACQRATTVHELVHLHLFAIGDALAASNAAFAGRVGAAATEALSAVVGAEIEKVTDALADAVAPAMPLPPWVAA